MGSCPDTGAPESSLAFHRARTQGEAACCAPGSPDLPAPGPRASSLQSGEVHISVVFQLRSPSYFRYSSLNRPRLWRVAVPAPPTPRPHTRRVSERQGHARQFAQAFPVPLVKPRRANLRLSGLRLLCVILQAGEPLCNKSDGNSVTLTFKAGLCRALEW